MESPKTSQPSRWHSLRLAIQLLLSLLFFMVLLWGFQGVMSASANAGTLYVDGASGSDTGECRDSANPCQTIAYAISQATDDDTILITSGTYSENLTITGFSLTLRGGYTISEANWLPGTEETIIDGGKADRVLLIHDSNSVLENLTITGGYASGEQCWGGGVWITNGDVTVRTSTITQNASECGGAGIEVNDDWGPAHLDLESSTVSSNTGGEKGGMNVYGENATVYIRDATFEGNISEAGAGISAEVNSSVVVEDTHIYRNSADGAGGAGAAGVRLRLASVPLARYRRLSVDHHPSDDLCAATCLLPQRDGFWRQ